MNLYYHGHLVNMDKAVDTVQNEKLDTLTITGMNKIGASQFPWDTIDLTPTGVLGSAGKKIRSTSASAEIGEKILKPFTDEVCDLIERIKKAKLEDLLPKPHK